MLTAAMRSLRRALYGVAEHDKPLVPRLEATTRKVCLPKKTEAHARSLAR